MARTELTKTTKPGSYSGSGAALTMTGADTSNQNSFKANGGDLVIAHNTDTSAHTVTINSVDDRYGRQEDISAESIAAGEIRIFGPFKIHGWMQSDGHIYLEADSSSVEFGIVNVEK
jgi:hypothetical protein